MGLIKNPPFGRRQVERMLQALMKLEIEPSWLNADYRGLFVELCGEEHDYNLHVKTNQLIKPWQSFRCTLPVEPI